MANLLSYLIDYVTWWCSTRYMLHLCYASIWYATMQILGKKMKACMTDLNQPAHPHLSIPAECSSAFGWVIQWPRLGGRFTSMSTIAALWLRHYHWHGCREFPLAWISESAESQRLCKAGGGREGSRLCAEGIYILNWLCFDQLRLQLQRFYQSRSISIEVESSKFTAYPTW